MPGTVPVADISPGIVPPATTPQSTSAGTPVPNADGRFPLSSVPVGYAMYREHDNHIMRSTTSGVPLSATVNGLSVKGMSTSMPAASSATLATLGVTPVANLQQVIMWASAANAIYMSYGGTASNTAPTSGNSVASIPIPTTPTVLNISAADLQALKVLGNGSATLTIIQLGFVAPI